MTEMRHKQKLAKWRVFNFFVLNWRYLKDISFLLVVFINILILIDYKQG